MELAEYVAYLPEYGYLRTGDRIIPFRKVSQNVTPVYPLRDDPALFMNLVSGPALTDGQVFQLVSQYGPLHQQADAGDSIEWWKAFLPQLQVAVKLWRAIRCDSEDLPQLLTAAPAGRESVDGVADDDYKTRAEYALDQLIRDMSHGPGLGHRVEYAAATGQRVRRLILPDLKTAILWQFVSAVIENHEFRQCQWCAKYINVAGTKAGGQYRHTTFCSPAHRQAAYHERKRSAKKLRKGGATLRDIAKRLGTDLATVKRWIGEN